MRTGNTLWIECNISILYKVHLAIYKYQLTNQIYSRTGRMFYVRAYTRHCKRQTSPPPDTSHGWRTCLPCRLCIYHSGQTHPNRTRLLNFCSLASCHHVHVVFCLERHTRSIPGGKAEFCRSRLLCKLVGISCVLCNTGQSRDSIVLFHVRACRLVYLHNSGI